MQLDYVSKPETKQKDWVAGSIMLNMLKTHTPQEIVAWVEANVTTQQDIIDLLKEIMVMITYIASSIE